MPTYLEKNLKGETLPKVFKINELLNIPSCERIQTPPKQLNDAPEGKTFICVIGYFKGENAPTMDSACVIDNERDLEDALGERIGEDDVAFVSWLVMDTQTVDKILHYN